MLELGAPQSSLPKNSKFGVLLNSCLSKGGRDGMRGDRREQTWRSIAPPITRNAGPNFQTLERAHLMRKSSGSRGPCCLHSRVGR